MSSRRLDKIIVIDLEATCWESKQARPLGMKNEIIEIGACFYNLQTQQPEQKTSYYIRPRQSEISQFCIDLTGITPELIKEKGIPFDNAVNKLIKEFAPKHRTWMSWGAYDRVMLQKECERQRVDYPMGINHINLKNWFSLYYKMKDELGLQKALSQLNIQFEGRQHSGADDAWNIARIIPYVT